MTKEDLSALSVKGVTSAFRLMNSPLRVPAVRKKRERWGVILKYRGATVYTVGEQKILSDATHPVLLPRGCSYTWECIEPGECYDVEFEADASADTLFSFTVREPETLVKYMRAILRRDTVKDGLYAMKNTRDLFSVLLLLLESEKAAPYLPTAKTERLRPALSHLAENFSDPAVTNDVLAEKCGISTVYFRRLFEEAYGVSPIRYLHRVRIEKAKLLLENDEFSVGQIAESVGYGSIYHFSKMFRAYTGTSPTAYRAERKK